MFNSNTAVGGRGDALQEKNLEKNFEDLCFLECNSLLLFEGATTEVSVRYQYTTAGIEVKCWLAYIYTNLS